MTFSYIAGLHCPKCQAIYEKSKIHHLCACGAPLLVDYHLEDLAKAIKPKDILTRNPDLWCYHELLPVQNECNVVSLGEGMTPLMAMPRLGQDMI